MKKVLIPAFVCAVVSLLFTACSSATKCAGSGKQVVSKTGTPCILEKQSPVRIGMTKAEVISVIGNPSTRTINSKGEIWTWNGTFWKRCLPFIGDHFNVERYSVEFGPNGKVVEFTVHHLFGHAFDEETTSGTILPSSAPAR
jgi:outer membrane protein assembly factor BamE (lipoprotein component of BamABCDE complex)